jgi:hypothetical protein
MHERRREFLAETVARTPWAQPIRAELRKRC